MGLRASRGFGVLVFMGFLRALDFMICAVGLAFLWRKENDIEPSCGRSTWLRPCFVHGSYHAVTRIWSDLTGSVLHGLLHLSNMH